MVNVKKEGVILQKSQLGFENEGVLNPAVIKNGEFTHLFYRAVSKGNYSSIGYCRLIGPFLVEKRNDVPIIIPTTEAESHGVEDPRIVEIDGTFYLTYIAYDGVNALGSLATSTDLVTWEKHGIIVPQISYNEFSRLANSKEPLNEKYLRYNEHEQITEKNGMKVLLWDKNVVFFPRRIRGKLYFLHRIKPDVQIVSFENLEDLTVSFWQNYFLHFNENILLSSKYDYEISYLGGGCPPIETPDGWLIIYHAVHDTIDGYVYAAAAALLDLEYPEKEIARLPYPIFKPELDYELKGEVNNVCFPTGAIVIEGILYVYYGAADEQIACASMNLSELLNELKLNISKYEIAINCE